MKALRLVFVFLFVVTVAVNAQEVNDPGKTVNVEPENISEEKDKQESKAETKSRSSLKPLVIKGRRVSTVEKAGTTTVVTDEDIQRRSDKLLKDILYTIPGLDVSTQRNGTTSFKMRGYDMSRIAILIDGIPLIDAFGDNLDIDNIGVMNNISEIVVTRGAASALYGTRAVAGSINLITKKPTELYAKVSAEYGLYGNYIGSFSQGSPIGNFFYYINGTYDKSNGYAVSGKLDRSEREEWIKKFITKYDLQKHNWTYEKIFGFEEVKCYLNDTGLWDNTSHEKYKANAKAGYNISSDLELGVSSFYTYSEMRTSVYTSKPYWLYTYNDNIGEKRQEWYWDEATKTGFRNSSSVWPEYYTYSVSPYLSYQQEKFKLKSSVFFYGQSSTYHSFDSPKNARTDDIGTSATVTWSIWKDYTYGVQMFPSYQLLPWNKLSSAIYFYESRHTQEEKAYDSRSTQTIAEHGTKSYKTLYIEADYLTLALEDEMRFSGNIDFSAGVSYDGQNITKYQKLENGLIVDKDNYKASMNDSMLWGTYDSINPVASITYEPFKDFLKLRASGSSKTSFPALRVYTLTESRYYETEDLGSNDKPLKPEKSINANTGYELSLFDRKLTWGVDYFYSRYSDKIERVWSSKVYEYYYRNIDLAIIQGAETVLQLNSGNILDVAYVKTSLTYTYTHGRKYAAEPFSEVNKGTRMEHLPTHKFTFDINANFKTDTTLTLFGYYEYDQVEYVVGSLPPEKDTYFTTLYFTPLKLHNPFMFNIKLSQKIYYDYELYVMCKNVLDDYAPDPLNPGPGRQFFFGAKAEL